jgi:AmmeMemoRadiSam system protein B
MSTSTHKPKLRPLSAMPIQRDGQELICLFDASGLSDKQILVNAQTFFILSRFDGEHTLNDVALAYTRQFGELLLGDRIGRIIEQLDEALLLESDRFRRYLADRLAAYRASGVREAVHAGQSYPSDPDELRAHVRGLFTADGGPGLPASSGKAAPITAVVAPHIDYARGGLGYAHAYKALAESAPADTYVILGIAHQPSGTPYVATRSTFATPLGRVEVDGELLDLVESDYAGDLYADEGLHISEHSIELQVVLLKALCPNKPFKIVPILAASLDQFLDSQAAPLTLAEVDAMARALRRALALESKRVCLIAAVDLAHVGNQFGDPGQVTAAVRSAIEKADRDMLGFVERGDAEAFVALTGADGGHRKICGVPALYVALRALDGAAPGELLHYGQAYTPETESVVSFAAMAFR